MTKKSQQMSTTSKFISHYLQSWWLNVSKTNIYIYFIHFFSSKFTFRNYFCTKNLASNKHPILGHLLQKYSIFCYFGCNFIKGGVEFISQFCFWLPLLSVCFDWLIGWLIDWLIDWSIINQLIKYCQIPNFSTVKLECENLLLAWFNSNSFVHNEYSNGVC